jgi:glycosyltransferase involved in cell wall biosynthesis
MTHVKQHKPIYVVTLHRPRSSGGIQKHVEVLVKAAQELGLSLEVVSPFNAPSALTFSAFSVNKILERLKSPLHAWWYETSRSHILRRVLQSEIRAPAIIYAQDPVSADAALSLKREGLELEIVYAIHYNLSVAEEWVGKGTLQRDSRFYHAMTERDQDVLTNVDRLVFVSNFMAQAVLSRHPEAAKVPRWIVPNVVETVNVKNTDAAVSSELINIGTLEPRKNQKFLLEVLHRAHRLGHPYKLTLVGDGKDFAALAAFAEKLSLTKFVTFAGNVPNAATLLPQHKVYVHAAHMESFGIVLVEAMAASLPVFAAPVGGVPEVFTDGTEGHYWSLDDPEGAAQKLISVLSNQERYQAMARAATVRYQTQFTPAVIKDKLIPILFGEMTNSDTEDVGL